MKKSSVKLCTHVQLGFLGFQFFLLPRLKNYCLSFRDKSYGHLSMYENKETFLSAFTSCRAKTKPTYEQINLFFFTFGYPFACDRGTLKPTHSN